MITRLKAENFQGLQFAEVTLGKLTIVHGPNESGKTSLLQALDFAADTSETRGTVRFASNAGVVNQNASSCRVAFEAEGHAFMRSQAKAGGSERLVDGLPYKVGEYARMLEETIGVSSKVFTAALCSGRLLDEKPQDLLDLLVAISGTKIGPGDITAELAPVMEALARMKLQAPRTLDGMTKTAAAAVEVRKEGKRALKAGDDALARCPVIPEMMRDEARPIIGVPNYSLAEALADLKAHRDTAIRSQATDTGAKDEREKQLRARIAELEAVPEEVQPSRTSLREAALRDDATARALFDAEGKLEDAQEAAQGSLEWPEGIETAAARWQDAVNHRNKLVEECDAHGAQAYRLSELLLASEKVANCGTCGQPIPKGYTETLRKALDAADAARDESRMELGEAQAEFDACEREGKTIAAVRARIAAHESIPALEAARLAAAQAREEAKRESDTLTAQQARWGNYKTAQTMLLTVRESLDALLKPAPAGESVLELDAAIKRTEELARTVEAIAKEDAIRTAIAAARQQIADADAVAQACGPDGAQARLVGRATLPFFVAANKALGEIVEGYEVRLDTTDGPHLVAHRGNVTLGTDELSKGRRQSVLYVLQVAVAMLTKAPIVVFDDPENLDADGRAMLVRLSQKCVSAGVQVLILTCAEAPQMAPEGVTMWSMSEGRAALIPSGPPPF